MALIDYFDEADVLDSFSWVAMPDETRTSKLAALYVKKERFIREHSRNYGGPSAGTVKVFVKSLYSPPRGTIGPTIKKVLAKIEHQKALRKARKDNQPWKHRKTLVRDRRNAIARSRFTIWGQTYQGEKEKLNPQCKAVGRVSGVLLIVAEGSYSAMPRVYMRSPEGKVKVVVVEGEYLKSITQALTRLAPKGVLRGMFSGLTVHLDFGGEAFVIDGQTLPWRNVRRVYKGTKRAHQTAAKPKRDE
jgi:hypothetical protein